MTSPTPPRTLRQLERMDHTSHPILRFTIKFPTYFHCLGYRWSTSCDTCRGYNLSPLRQEMVSSDCWHFFDFVQYSHFDLGPYDEGSTDYYCGQIRRRTAQQKRRHQVNSGLVMKWGDSRRYRASLWIAWKLVLIRFRQACEEIRTRRYATIGLAGRYGVPQNGRNTCGK